MDANDRRARATEEASKWWTRLGTQAPAEVSEADRQEFTQWLRESHLHVAELLHVAHVHDALERFKLWGEFESGAGPEESNISALPLPPPVQRRDLRSEAPAKGGRRTRFLLVAGVALVAIAAGWLTLRSSSETISTERAERREVVLADGSIVSLEPETRLRVDLGKQERHVVLTRGRALFHVAKDPGRPFVVRAGDTNVRAVGTVFGIEQKNRSIIVTVSEGKVAVARASQLQSDIPPASSPFPRESTGAQRMRGSSQPGNGEREPSQAPEQSVGKQSPSLRGSGNAMASGAPGEVFLTADQQITVQESGAASPIQNVDSNSALAWSEGRLVFDSTPLDEVAAEFNRYNRVQLRIRGNELSHRTISGVFRASDPETLIDFIGAGARVAVTRNGNEEIVISPGS